ncbi:PAS domain-containing protein [Vibrio ostreicida]|uniref:PAS domain-containing protein n=1 Tax=Vibrio ostreicida TaxID=526588 RepID=A0ABT8BXA4_9VIBR|nr:PAS domain-containing protein [Vibrio ostreicida]MDN3611775.1 PAS domain-containing protein [Vibrio ostreicida]NPD09590.1 hypothetical protein [Vibrio ostreicida]
MDRSKHATQSDSPMVLKTNRKGDIIYISAGFMSLDHAAEQGLLGASLESVVAKHIPDCFKTLLKETLDKGQSFAFFTQIDTTSSQIWVLCLSYPDLSLDGCHEGYIAVHFALPQPCIDWVKEVYQTCSEKETLSGHSAAMAYLEQLTQEGPDISQMMLNVYEQYQHVTS